MIITISKPDEQFYRHVEKAATQAACEAWVKWHDKTQIRFVLLERPTIAPRYDSIGAPPKRDNYASDKQHDDVIARLFMEDPHATIRTAKAVFKGAADFYAQKGSRMTA